VTLRDLIAGAGDRFLFHYTNIVFAETIWEYQLFVSGPSAAYGVGIYATDIPPTGPATIREVSLQCFSGQAQEAELQYAIVVHRELGDLRFEQTSNPYHWLLNTKKLAFQPAGGLLVAMVGFNGVRWKIMEEA